jgi:hypothetical protein
MVDRHRGRILGTHVTGSTWRSSGTGQPEVDLNSAISQRYLATLRLFSPALASLVSSVIVLLRFDPECSSQNIGARRLSPTAASLRSYKEYAPHQTVRPRRREIRI